MFNNRIQLFIISRMIAHTAQLLKKDLGFFLGGGGLGAWPSWGWECPLISSTFVDISNHFLRLGFFFDHIFYCDQIVVLKSKSVFKKK